VDHDWRPLHPAVRTVWSVKTALVGTVALAIATALVLFLGLPLWLLGFAVPIVVVVAILATVGTRWRYERWVFRFAPGALELRYGVWFRTVSAVPYHRIQQIDIEQGPIERRLGIVTLSLTTASSASDGWIPGIHADEADGIRERLVEAADRDDGV
jgi:membrane protein YdbS with pleckstrin-like domain